MILAGELLVTKEKAEGQLPPAGSSCPMIVEVVVMEEPRIHHVDDICSPARCPLATRPLNHRRFTFEKTRTRDGWYWKVAVVA